MSLESTGLVQHTHQYAAFLWGELCNQGREHSHCVYRVPPENTYVRCVAWWGKPTWPNSSARARLCIRRVDSSFVVHTVATAKLHVVLGRADYRNVFLGRNRHVGSPSYCVQLE